MKKSETAEKKAGAKGRGLKYAVAIIAALALIAAVTVLLRFAGKGFLQRPYDASQPTAQKFAKIARWIPPNAEFDVSVDVQKALADAALRDRLASLVKGQDGVASDFVSALLERQSVVGMLMLVGTLGDTGAEPAVAVVAQGGFDEKSFIPAIRAALAAGRSGIAAEELGGRKLYAESDARDPFGFVVLDREHIAVGSRASLVALFAGPPSVAPKTLDVVDAVVFGRFTFGPRLIGLLPQGFAPVTKIEFASTDGKSVSAKIDGGSVEKAQDVRMFLEGIRALLLLQEEGNPALEGILKGVAIDNSEGSVTIACEILPLLDLWVPTNEPAPTPEGTDE